MTTWTVQSPLGPLHLYYCVNCGCPTAVTEEFIGSRRKDKKPFYCPNGHPMSYHENEADRLRRERDRLQQQVAQRDDDIAAKDRAITALKGQITKAKKRAAHGVCPCCTRSFANVNRHMRMKHPDYVNESSGKVVPLKTA